MAWGFKDIAARYVKTPKTPWSGGLRLIFDLEADGLLDTATTVHCIVIIDLATGEIFIYGPDQIAAGLEHLSRAVYLVGHNIQNYDLPLLKKLYGWAPSAGCVVRDTLILARLIFPAVGELDDIVTGMAKARGEAGIGQLRGKHSIEAWGARLGIAKSGTDITDWSQWTQEMQDRCVDDTKICKAFWCFAKPDGYSQYAVELEHRAAEVCEAIKAAGVPFDVAGAQRLADRLRVRRAELRGPLQAQFPGVNFNSNKQLIALFESRGWKPSKRTKTGQPKLGDEMLTTVATLYPEFHGLAEFLKLGRLLAHLATGDKALCKHVGNDGRIHGTILHIGTPHSRAAHFGPNLAQVPNPKKGAAFGAECRSLFRAPKDWVCVPCDQNGLQDRGLANYLAPHDGGAYAASFAAGTDTHWRSATALGLVLEGTARDKANPTHTALREGSKRFRYAFLYGVGAEKAGTIIYETCRGVHNAAPEIMARFFPGTTTPSASTLKRVGRQAIDRFIASTPGLAELRAKLIAHQSKHQWLPGLDGRRVPVREQHVALNYIVTSFEAIICKRWLVRVYDELRAQFHYGWDGEVTLALWVHDELVAFCKPEIADQVGKILVRCAREPATFYSFKAPLDADCVVAPSWAGELTMEVEGPPPGTVVPPDEETAPRPKKPRKKKRADTTPELPLDQPQPAAIEPETVAPPTHTWREDITAINAAMVEQGIDALPLSEVVMSWVPPWEKPAPPKANGARPLGGAQHAGNGATAPQAAGSSGGSHSGKPSANGAGKSYKRVRAALQGSGYRIAASFNYCLPDGTVLFTEDRYELFDPHRNSGLAHKEYRFRHTVGGTEYSDTGPRRIIYNWPAIMKAGPGATVYVVEGPYKADTLIRAGLLATAAPYHQWVPECVEALAGRHLIYLADHDHNDAKGRNAGREHAERARKALAATAASFRVVPALLLWQSLGRNGEPPHGWDVRDWIEAGPTVALSQICAAVSGENELMLIKASSVTAKAVRWLWLNHLARGGLELLTGLPGLGKSQIQIWYVACATTGKDWPDGSPGCEPCDVIMLTAEDTLDDTMVPRLIAAGANLDRVHFLPYIKRNGRDETFLLAEDLDKLEAHLRTHPEVGLVTLDPITAYLGSGKGLDSHRASDVRSQLSPLKAAAERTLVAFSAVTHPPKSAGPNAHDHFIGSQAFIAAARKGHLCAPETEADGEDVPRPTGRYFFTDAKRNLTKRTPTLVYRIEDVDTERHDPETGECIHAPVIRWEGVEDIMVEEAIAASKPRSGRENVGLKVQKFLTELLAGGPLPYATVMERGAANGYSVDQLKRLKRAMGAVAFKDKAVWMWALAEHAPGSEEDAPEEGRL